MFKSIHWGTERKRFNSFSNICCAHREYRTLTLIYISEESHAQRHLCRGGCAVFMCPIIGQLKNSSWIGCIKDPIHSGGSWRDDSTWSVLLPHAICGCSINQVLHITTQGHIIVRSRMYCLVTWWLNNATLRSSCRGLHNLIQSQVDTFAIKEATRWWSCEVFGWPGSQNQI